MRTLIASFCLLALASCLTAEDIPAILQRMNAETPAFHSMSADVQMVTYTAIIDSTISESGTLKMQKGRGNEVRAIVDFSAVKDSSRVIGLSGKMVRMYFPNAKYYQDYDFGKNGDLINQFLLLGFGASGDELSKSYTITSEGLEKIGSITTTKMLLVPIDSKVKEKLARVELWIPEGQSSPIQQQFFEEPSGNYRKMTYSKIQLNPPIRGNLEIRLPAGTQKRN